MEALVLVPEPEVPGQELGMASASVLGGKPMKDETEVELAYKRGQAEMSAALERGINGAEGCWPDWVYEVRRKLAATPPVAEPPPRISLGKDWPATKDRLVREIRAAEKLTGADMAQRIGVAETPREPEHNIPPEETCVLVALETIITLAKDAHQSFLDAKMGYVPPAPLTRAEEAQPGRFDVTATNPGPVELPRTPTCHGWGQVGPDCTHFPPEPPPEAQSDKTLVHLFEGPGDCCSAYLGGDPRETWAYCNQPRAAHAPGATGEKP
jgi:hypothetical protein